MGVVHFQVDDFEEAESCFQRALGLCEPQLGSLLIAPTWEPTLCNLARTYQKMGLVLPGPAPVPSASCLSSPHPLAGSPSAADSRPQPI